MDAKITPITPTTYYESGNTGEDLMKTPEGTLSILSFINGTFTCRLPKLYFFKLINRGGKRLCRGIYVDGNIWKLGVLDNEDIKISDKRLSGLY